MTKYDAVKSRISAGSDMDYVGICPSSVLENEPIQHRPSTLLPDAKSIIVFGRRLINGSVQGMFRYLEDGLPTAQSVYSAHSFVLAINQLCMKQTYDIAQFLENTYGCMAMPVTNNVLQAVQPEGNFVPFFADPYKAGLPIDIYKAGVAAGLGEMGWNHRVITPDNGPRVYLCAIVTNIEFEKYDEPYAGEKLCDPEKCGVCSKMCPTHALSASEGKDVTIAGKTYRQGELKVNACAIACFGLTKKTNMRCPMDIQSEDPTDEELAKGLQKQFDAPGFQTLDHLPMYCCDRCLLYCPVGNYKSAFVDRNLTKNA